MTGVFFQLALEQLEMGEGIGCAAGETCQYTVVVESPDLAGIALHDGVATRDLAIAADDHVVVAPDRQDGCTPELLHVLLRTDRADDCTPSIWGQSG